MPPFDPNTGYLPAGVHSFAWADIVARFASNTWRMRLTDGLYRAAAALRHAGCTQMIIDGSFVTAKASPGDFDAAYDPVGVDGLALDPILRKYDDGRRAMKAKYFGEVFPWGAIACAQTGTVFLNFFQQDSMGIPKGVVHLDLGKLP